MIDSTLHTRFLTLETEFLSAIANGDSAISDFAIGRGSTTSPVSSLLRDYKKAVELRQVDTETMRLASVVVSRLAVLADTFLSLDSEADGIRQRLQVDVDGIFSQVDSEDLFELPTSRSLDTVAHHWLLENIHDPYPSNAIKTSIAERCNCPIKDVQEWFADARRQTGWTALSRDQFGGSRQATTAAARQAYSESGAALNLPSVIQRAFLTIKANAQNIHPSRQPSTIDNTPVTQLPELSEHAIDGSIRQSDVLEWLAQESPAPGSYDSLSAFMPYTSSTTFTVDDEEDTTPPPPIAGCKRSLDICLDSTNSQLDCPPDSGTIDLRPPKRHRCTSATPREVRDHRAIMLHSGDNVPQQIFRCSPAPRTSSPASEASNLVSPLDIPVSAAPMRRKRRLSDSSSSHVLKRPRGLDFPRKQAVSDPFPMNSVSNASEPSTDERLQSCAELSKPAEIGDMDPSLLFDVELATFLNNLRDESVMLHSPVSQLDVSDADLAAATIQGFDLSTFEIADVMASGSQGMPTQASSHNHHAPPSSSASSSPESSDFGPLDDMLCMDWTRDWIRFVNIPDPSTSSPTSSQLSFSDCASDSPLASCLTSSSKPDDIPFSLFGTDPSLTSSDLLSNLCELPSLHMPLETMFQCAS